MKSDWLTVCFISLFLAEKAGFWWTLGPMWSWSRQPSRVSGLLWLLCSHVHSCEDVKLKCIQNSICVVCARGWMWFIKRYAAIFPSSLHLHPSFVLTSGAACCYETDITAAVCLRQAFIIYSFRFSLCNNFRTFFWCWVSEKIYRFHPSQLQLKVHGWSVSSYFLSLHCLHSKYTPPAPPACLGVIVIISKRHTFFFFFLLSRVGTSFLFL